MATAITPTPRFTRSPEFRTPEPSRLSANADEAATRWTQGGALVQDKDGVFWRTVDVKESSDASRGSAISVRLAPSDTAPAAARRWVKETVLVNANAEAKYPFVAFGFFGATFAAAAGDHRARVEGTVAEAGGKMHALAVRLWRRARDSGSSCSSARLTQQQKQRFWP